MKVHRKFHEDKRQEDFVSDSQAVFKSENNALFLVHFNVASVEG